MNSYVVTGGGRGIGRAIVERLARDGSRVVVIERDPSALDWTGDASGVTGVTGSAADDEVASEAVALASSAAPLAGWVNNAAVFRDASVHTATNRELLDLIGLNFEPALVGSATAVRAFLAAGTPGSIVNVSSHQGQRAVPGCLPYSTAKAAIEGLTRALAVEYGPQGIRVNAVALGSISTERYTSLLSSSSAEDAARIEDEMRRLHPLGRVGRTSEVAEAVAFLLSDAAGFVSGTTLPVDGGRAALAFDPEA